MFKIYLNKAFFIIATLLILPSQLFSQKDPIKFGKISKEDLEMTVYAKDTTAEAVILTDYGISEIRYDSNNSFGLVFTNHTRIKILKKEGLRFANVDVRLYSAGTNTDERMGGFKAQTYNLENGKIATSKLSKKDVFDEDKSKHMKLKKFALPNVKVGSVIEYKYTITSEFLYVKPWYFQTTIPVIWSEYRTLIPEYYTFKRFFGRYLSPDISESSGSSATFPNGEIYKVENNRYVFKDIPAFRNEDYITTPNDYLAKVEFEHLSTNIPDRIIETYTSSWPEICIKLLERIDFGTGINHHGIVKDLSELINSNDNAEKKVIEAYKAIKRKMKWNGYNGIYAENTLRSAYNDNEGNVAEINLLLVNLLRSVDIESYPVLLSTRSHGKINKYFPKQSNFNYVVALAKVNGKDILLDASRDFLEPGNLPFSCINGQGLVVTKGMEKWVDLRSNENFRKSTTVFMSLDETGMKANLQRITFGLSARDLRLDIANTGKSKYVENYITNKEDWIIDEFIINNEKDVTKPVVEKIKISEFSNIDTDGSLIYIPAIIATNDIENPFTDETRKYPVDFAVPVSSKYILSFTLPKGYEIEELPENSIISLPEKAAKFTYKAKTQNGSLQIYCQIKINKTFFLPDEYKLLRNFYMHITEKLNEQIVLKNTQQ